MNANDEQGTKPPADGFLVGAGPALQVQPWSSDWKIDQRIEPRLCLACGKPTLMQVLYQTEWWPCHDSCLEGLMKLHPEAFRPATEAKPG